MFNVATIQFPGETPTPMVVDGIEPDAIKIGSVFRVAGHDLAVWQEVECIGLGQWRMPGFMVQRTQLEIARIKLELGDALIRDAENIINAEFNKARDDKHALLALARKLPACNTKRFVLARLRELGFCGLTIYESGPWIGEGATCLIERRET